ncbi:MAG: HAMP domain-containing sensor histidine kinase [Bacteroidales bacterium]
MAILLSVYLDKYENNYRVKLVKNIITTDNFYFDKVYNSDRSDITSEYSFAYFVNDQLKEQHGEYKYGYNALNYLLNSEGKEFIELRGYKHFLFRINDKTLIVVSKKTSAYFSKTASYSFFVILFIFYSFAVFIVTNLFTKIRYKKLTFRDRIQWTILGSFLIISIIICALSINLFMKSYGEKYEDMFIGKINSLCNYFNEEKLSFVQTPENRKFLDSKLEELSNIFANEINLYDKNGNLLSSSDYDYFNKNGYAKTLNNTLFDPIFKKKITLYVDKNITYSKLLMMVYKPVFDENGEIRAIFNLNVVAKHDEFKSDLSNLIVQFLSAYAYIILFSIILSWILYLFISKPLGVIGKILNNNNSENKQIKVGWSDNDEIGRLIKEHNRMVEELQKNARKMATSERRTAWREMAQEIAHEIKNPLTPMKLNIQMLQQSWNDKRSDFDGRLEKTTKQLVEQIDVLTKTADLFNEFALSENAINSEENIALILNDFEKSLTNETKIDLLFNYDQNKNYAAFVDKAQFSKMLSYLLNVAIQNQRPHTKLTVSISLSDLNNNFWLLTFADNGKGLNIDSNKDLFSFKFNTEGCISCLRFPIIKNIVIRFGGKISFSTEENVGTEYNILIPKS